MFVNFNSVFLNELKTRAGDKTSPIQLIDLFKLQSYFEELTPEEKEKIFTICSQAIIEDIHASLTQVLSMTRKNKTENSRFHYYPLTNEAEIGSKNSSDEIQAISVCELAGLMLFFEQPCFQEFVDCIALLNQRSYMQGIVEADSITEERLKEFILNKEYLQKKKPLVKVVSQKLNEIFYILQQAVLDFGQGYKVLLDKENDEKFYFSVSNNLMYQFNSTGKFVRRSLGAYIHKLYSNFLAVAFVFENKLLRKYQKYLIRKPLSLTQDTSSPIPNDPTKGIHYGCLAFLVNDHDEEEKEYQDSQPLIKDITGLQKTVSNSEGKKIQDGRESELKMEELKNFTTFTQQENYFEQPNPNAYYQPQQPFRPYGYPYKRKNQGFYPPMMSPNQGTPFYQNQLPENYMYQPNPNPGFYQNGGYMNYNTNYQKCGFGEVSRRNKKHNTRNQDHNHHTQYVKSK